MAEQQNGHKVLAFRVKAGISQSELGSRLCVSHGFVSLVESNRKSLGYASALTLQELSEGEIDALDVVSIEERTRIERMRAQESGIA